MTKTDENLKAAVAGESLARNRYSYFAEMAKKEADTSIDLKRTMAEAEPYFLDIQELARLTGNDDVHGLAISDLCTTNNEISSHTAIAHV